MEYRPQSHQETDSPHLIYSRYITSCYSRQPAASPYYQQLQDYLKTDGSPLLQKPKCFELKTEALRTGSLTDSDLSSPRRRPCIVVLDGFPSPQCISTIGAKEMVRPELFIGHLDFACDRSYRKFFELPSVPSDRRNVIHVRLISMAQAATGDTKVKSFAQARSQADKKCTDIEHQLFSNKQYGAPRYRKVHLHDSRTFSVEQLVSFSITQRENEPWCGKFFSESGVGDLAKHLQEFSYLTEANRFKDNITFHGQITLEGFPQISFQSSRTIDQRVQTIIRAPLQHHHHHHTRIILLMICTEKTLAELNSYSRILS